MFVQHSELVVDGDRQDVATMPLSLGGLGLRDALRTSPPVFWPAGRIVLPWFGRGILMWLHCETTGPPTLMSVQAVAHQLIGVDGFEPPFKGSFGEGPTPSATRTRRI